MSFITMKVLKNDTLDKKLEKVKTTNTKNKIKTTDGKSKLERKLYSKNKKKKSKKSIKGKNNKTKIVYAEQKSEIDRKLEGNASRCLLSGRVYPLLFYGTTQSIEFKVLLSSDCLDRPILQYFLVPPKTKTNLTFMEHPSFVNLVIFGRQFKFKYTVPYQRGTGFNKNIAYQYFQIYPATVADTINTFDEHIINISSVSPENFFTLNEIKSLASILNPYPCNIIQSNKIFNCVVS